MLVHPTSGGKEVKPMRKIDMSKNEAKAPVASTPVAEVQPLIDMSTPVAEVQPLIDMRPIQTKHVAQMLGMKATALRRVLRSMPEYADGVHTSYRWAGLAGDPEVDRIVAKVNHLADRKIARALAAKAALDARAAVLKARQDAEAAALAVAQVAAAK
jgi:hypothetical protein